MASVAEIEEWFSILGAGLAGLRLLKEYGIQAVELKYFVENFDQSKMRISAFAPTPLRDQYEPRFSGTKAKITSGIAKLVSSNCNLPDEELTTMLAEIKEMYMLLNDAHRTVSSGFILT